MVAIVAVSAGHFGQLGFSGKQKEAYFCITIGSSTNRIAN